MLLFKLLKDGTTSRGGLGRGNGVFPRQYTRATEMFHFLYFYGFFFMLLSFHPTNSVACYM